MNKKMMLLFSLFVLSFVFISGTVYAFSFGDVYSVLFGSVLSVFDTSDTVPVINAAYLDKQKYMPGEQMIVTASVSGAKYVKAYIETDVGVDEVDMVLVTGTKEDGTWQVAWTLHDTVTKEYFTKIVAVSKDDIEDEKVLIWADPTVSHSWDETVCDNNLCVDTINNRIGIGITTPIETLDVVGNIKIKDGTQADGKVLTSDADGLASWQEVSGGVIPSMIVALANVTCDTRCANVGKTCWGAFETNGIPQTYPISCSYSMNPTSFILSCFCY
ncbi:MAG: hypothetical protein K0B07_00440 [DPANN group archaeon]|nr:hypothetical protein [DPANN group archaeon]